MKYIVKVNGLETYEGIENRVFEFDNEAKALHERYWYIVYTNAKSVELIKVNE